MKALVLAGGRGKRLNELFSNMNKCMIRVMGRPVIEYGLDCVVATDIEDIIIIIGYGAEDIINHLGNNYKGKKIKYVIQSEQRGLVHAMECAREALDGEDFMLLLGDEVLINPGHQKMLDDFRKNSLFGICGVLEVENTDLIKQTYTLKHDENNIIIRLVEKPRKPLNNYMGTGNCIFRNSIFDYVEYTPIHHERKEKELPDLIQSAIDDGHIVKSFILCDKYANINSKEDIARAESFFENQ